jgi:CO/xanthine dehydrogenase Mo-binding subunit
MLFALSFETGRWERSDGAEKGNMIAPLSTSLISHFPGMCEYIFNVALRCKHSATLTHNLTYPFGSYICVVDIDRGTGEVHIRRFMAVDDCGTVINPMIVEGQVQGGLTQGLAPAMYEEISYSAAPGIIWLGDRTWSLSSEDNLYLT